jgi:hypothetical protein
MGKHLYDGLEQALIERSDSTFPPAVSDAMPAIQGLDLSSLAGFFDLLGDEEVSGSFGPTLSTAD